MKKINVLSLFGGIECGRVAMDRLGWEVGNYYSSEIDEYAKKITSARWPDIIHVGSVTDVSYIDTPQGGVLQTGNFSSYESTIDILIGGSPCQDLSIAKAWGKGLEGEKSGLFYEYVRILQETKPEYFLLENVASMRKADRDKISEVLGIEPIIINSNLVSAQNRKRLYWIGKKLPGGGYEKVEVQQPEDCGILLADILEDIPLEDERWKILDEKYREKVEKSILEIKNKNIPSKILDINGGWQWNRVYSIVGKSAALGANWGGAAGASSNLIVGYYSDKKSYAILSTFYKENVKSLVDRKKTWLYIIGLAHRNRGEGKAPECEKANSLTTVQSDSEVLLVSKKSYPVTATYAGACPRDFLEKNQRELVIAENENIYLWRKLTVKECERLQTLPDDYTEGVSNSRRYKAIGNGWTVDVIAHILSYFIFDNY